MKKINVNKHFCCNLSLYIRGNTKLFHFKGLDKQNNNTTACFIYPWEILVKAEYLTLCEPKFAVLKIAENLGV